MKNLFTNLIAIGLLLIASTGMAQQAEQLKEPTAAQSHLCGENGSAIYDMALQYPGTLERVRNLRARIMEAVSVEQRASPGQVCTIPVVFHIIHNGEPIGVGSNIPDAALQSQIDVLNECLSMGNADIGNVRAPFQNSVGNAQVQVCLAQLDPNGVPTLGITRQQGSQGNFFIGPDNGLIMPGNQWDPTRYLHIYTVTGAAGSNIATGTPPGFPLQTDGIVLDFRSVGRIPFTAGATFFGGMFTLGRVAVHEMGHYLGLMHLDGFGNGNMNGCANQNPTNCMFVGDKCCDTPDQPRITFSCLGTEFSCGSLDQIENFMQANNDACRLMFTIDQTNIMRPTLLNQRAGLLNGTQCNRTFRAVAISPVGATLEWSGTVGAVGYNVRWNFLGMVMGAPMPPAPMAGNGNVMTGTPATSLAIAGLTASAAYGWSVRAVFADGTMGQWEPINGATFRTLPMVVAPPVACPFDPNEGAIFGPYIQNGGGQAYGIICPMADRDRFVFPDLMPERSRLYINLTNVTQDYDMDLVDANTGAVLAQSLTIGIANEQIIFDTPIPLQNYYVYVYGKAGLPVSVIPYFIGIQQIPLSANPPRMSDPDLLEFKVYPNPAQNQATVRFATQTAQQTEVRVFDVSGRSVLQMTLSGEGLQTVDLDLSKLSPGIYKLDVMNEEFKNVSSIMKR